MHRPILFLSALAVTLFFAVAGCERHSWNETKKLHEPHHGHATGDGHDHSKEKEGGHPEEGAAKK